MGQVNGGTGVIVSYFIIRTIPGVRPDEDDANTRDQASIIIITQWMGRRRNQNRETYSLTGEKVIL